MLFARFLPENQLLMHPDHVAVSLAKCDEPVRVEDPETHTAYLIVRKDVFRRMYGLPESTTRTDHYMSSENSTLINDDRREQAPARGRRRSAA
jgi:hypothetical protein